MNVVFIKSHYGKTGGIETLLKSLFGCLDFDRFRVHILAVTHDPDLPLSFVDADELPDSARLHIIPWRGLKSLPATIKTIIKLFQEIRPDVLYTHDMRANLLAFFVTRSKSIPWMAHVHGWLGKTAGFKTRFFEWIDSKLIKKADVVLVGSHALKETIEKKTGRKEVCLIPNGIEISFLQNEQGWDTHLRETLFPGFSGVIVGTLCRLHRGKGAHIMLEAFAQLKNNNYDIRCAILGVGPEEENLKQQAKDLGVEAYVVFSGHMKDTRPYLNMLDVFALCSFTESMPLSLLEALCMGVPSIATDVGDISYALNFGTKDLLVQPGNVAEFRQALTRLLDDPSLRETYGRLGKERVETGYSMNTMVEEIEDNLAEVASGADRTEKK